MREGFGLIVVEAASQGTPSLTFDVNGYRDLIENGVNGFVVPFPDVTAMAQRMDDLVLMDAARYAALCEACLAAATRYSWDGTAADVNRILTRILAQETPR
jgi:phosphatidyl-myo-inositol alpha-mannosyltransferase